MQLTALNALIGFTYLVTKDLAETLERKLGFVLKPEDKVIIRKLEEAFLSEFWQYIPANAVGVALSCDELSKSLEARMVGGPVVSLDRVYFPKADSYLDVTRLTDQKTGRVRIGPRPGAVPLEQQLAGISGPVVVADVGAYEGTTLLEICAAMQVSSIYLGVADKKALDRLSKQVPTLCLYTFDLCEWIELRDLFGIDGRIIPSNGNRRFMPYWENLPGWASVPQDAAPLCKRYNKELLALLEVYDLGLIGEVVAYGGAECNLG